MAEVGGDLLQFGFVSHFNRLGLRVNFGGVGKDGSLETSFDDPVVLDIEVREKGDERERENCECAQGETKYGIAKAASRSMTVIPTRDAKLNGHVDCRLCSA
jgi:hypothetical protein